MAEEIVDCYSALSPGPLKQQGFLGIARYIAQQEGKCETSDEFHAYMAGGLTNVWVYEDGADDGLGGATVGQAKGQIARPILQSFGVDPAEAVVYFGFDFPIQPSQYQVCFACLQSFGQAAGCIPGVYGAGPFIAWCFARGIKYGWETGSRSWDGGVYAGQLYQGRYSVPFQGTLIDIDTVLAADYGQWPRPNIPAPPPKTTGGNMIASNPAGEGTWVTNPIGGVDCFDFAPGEGFYGSLPQVHVTPAKPIIGICPTPTGKGYWLAGSDGGVFAFGDAKPLGSLVGHPDWGVGGSTDKPCVGISPWRGDGTLAGGLGFVLGVQPPAGATPELYHFPGNGQYA